MMIKKILVVLLGLVLLFSVVPGRSVLGKTLEEIQDEINQYQKELERLGSQAKTLSNQISQFDAQIKLTTLRISETEEKISLLGGRISLLEDSLTNLSSAYSERVAETYKLVRLGDPVYFILGADDISSAVSRFQYLKKIQEEDMSLLQRLQVAQTNYKVERETQEQLQSDLKKNKAFLDSQKKAKASLLSVTRNDERKYQQLLASAQAELAVVLGQGKESFLRSVSAGEIIGSVIPSASGCSSGQHLHFETHSGSSIVDPSNFLKPISYSYSYNSSQYGYYGTINPHGSWDWPMNEPIQVNQGFGSHGFAQAFYPGGVHNGIDLDSGDTGVKAVRDGKLYGGSYQCGGRYPGTLLYAKIEHSDGMITWYLHMTPR